MKKLIPKKAYADALCGEIVRSRGYCEVPRFTKSNCKGNLQWAHIFSRSYYQIRWDPNNALCMCAGHHMYFTQHPIEWEELVKRMIGEENYQALRKMALDYKKIDYGDIMYELNQKKKAGLIMNEYVQSWNGW